MLSPNKSLSEFLINFYWLKSARTQVGNTMYIMNYWSQMSSPSNLWRYLLLLPTRMAKPVHLYFPFQIPWATHAWTPLHPKQSSWWESCCQLPWFLPAVFCSCECSGVACILLNLYINISSCWKWHSFLFQFPIILSEYIEIQLILVYEFWILWHCLIYLLQLSRGLCCCTLWEKEDIRMGRLLLPFKYIMHLFFKNYISAYLPLKKSEQSFFKTL